MESMKCTKGKTKPAMKAMKAVKAADVHMSFMSSVR
jgi:hypothetical protein